MCLPSSLLPNLFISVERQSCNTIASYTVVAAARSACSNSHSAVAAQAQHRKVLCQLSVRPAWLQVRDDTAVTVARSLAVLGFSAATLLLVEHWMGGWNGRTAGNIHRAPDWTTAAAEVRTITATSRPRVYVSQLQPRTKPAAVERGVNNEQLMHHVRCHVISFCCFVFTYHSLF